MWDEKLKKESFFILPKIDMKWTTLTRVLSVTYLDLGFDFDSPDAESFPLLDEAKKLDSLANDGLATRPRPKH